ncbi:LppA family lipoprotein, partial [Mycolicibacterium thermoresistibile]
MRKPAMRSTLRCGRSAVLGRVAAVVLALLFAVGCGGGDGRYDSPLLNEDVPVVDIADLADIEQTKTQMLDLIERVRAEVARLVPESDPWNWNRDESRGGCTQEKTGRKGVSLSFANLVSTRPFTEGEWNHVLPAVQR